MFLISFILALRAAVVAKLVILSISFLTSFILALRVALVARLIISDVLSSIYFILVLYVSFLIIETVNVSHELELSPRLFELD